MERKFIFDIQRFAFGGGSGTSSNPYIIHTAVQLKELANNVSNWSYAQVHYKLGADIDCSTLSNFTPIGTTNSTFKETLELGRNVSCRKKSRPYKKLYERFLKMIGIVSRGAIKTQLKHVGSG